MNTQNQVILLFVAVLVLFVLGVVRSLGIGKPTYKKFSEYAVFMWEYGPNPDLPERLSRTQKWAERANVTGTHHTPSAIIGANPHMSSNSLQSLHSRASN
jgi:hypothetical protein